SHVHAEYRKVLVGIATFAASRHHPHLDAGDRRAILHYLACPGDLGEEEIPPALVNRVHRTLGDSQGQRVRSGTTVVSERRVGLWWPARRDVLRPRVGENEPEATPADLRAGVPGRFCVCPLWMGPDRRCAVPATPRAAVAGLVNLLH